jgi:hypothetical protein
MTIEEIMEGGKERRGRMRASANGEGEGTKRNSRDPFELRCCLEVADR